MWCGTEDVELEGWMECGVLRRKRMCVVEVLLGARLSLDAG